MEVIALAARIYLYIYKRAQSEKLPKLGSKPPLCDNQWTSHKIRRSDEFGRVRILGGEGLPSPPSPFPLGPGRARINNHWRRKVLYSFSDQTLKHIMPQGVVYLCGPWGLCRENACNMRENRQQQSLEIIKINCHLWKYMNILENQWEPINFKYHQRKSLNINGSHRKLCETLKPKENKLQYMKVDKTQLGPVELNEQTFKSLTIFKNKLGQDHQ